MKFDLEKLNKYIEEGLVVKNEHPTLPISIYNYSRKTQYENNWDEITKQCRGLILDNEGYVIAKGFDKFFNMEELVSEDIPNETFEVFEKLDGSLGILFWYEGKWILSTKGSFFSEQSIKGKEILDSKYNIHPIPKGYTTLIEILFPQNRIVCNYGNDESLVVLSMISNASGKELDYDSLKLICEETKMPLVKKYDGIGDYKTLKSMIDKEREGYVIRFKNGFRMKIKSEEYVRLHRILTGFSNVDIWEYLKDNKDINQLLDKVPDEFDVWVRNTKTELESKFKSIEDEYNWIYEVIMRVENSSEKKVFAEYAKRYEHSSILFKMFDKKDYSDYLWKIIRPKYSKPFWQKEIEL